MKKPFDKYRTWRRSNKAPEPQEDETMPPAEPKHSLDCSSNKDIFERPRTRFYDHFGIDNIPFGIACSAAHPELGVVTRHHDRVLFLDSLAKTGLLRATDAAIKTFSGVSSISMPY
jgi:hypothetical protein